MEMKMAKVSRRGFFGRALGGFAAALRPAKAVTTDGPWLVGDFSGAPPPARLNQRSWARGVTNLQKGDIITISGSWSVNPPGSEDRLQRFVVTSK